MKPNNSLIYYPEILVPCNEGLKAKKYARNSMPNTISIAKEMNRSTASQDLPYFKGNGSSSNSRASYNTAKLNNSSTYYWFSFFTYLSYSMLSLSNAILSITTFSWIWVWSAWFNSQPNCYSLSTTWREFLPNWLRLLGCRPKTVNFYNCKC